MLALVTVLAAVWFGWQWWSAATNGDLAYAQARDSVLAAGQRQVITLNTLDYRSAEEGLTQWQRVSTGDLLDELTRNHDSDLRTTQSTRTTTTAKVLGAAVSRLDLRAGTADVLVAVEVTATPEGGKPSVRRSRLDAALTKAGDDWKVRAVQAIGVSG
ncbi:Mce-associated membrane protein [Kutzneria viridogrisea]|uniref:Mce-associated membrane protein n=1 Tax=Kutzneria viridogrisea TaxID=47990 RepID=A0ABR6BM51_9PSEU|nr:hypothetical protein [Kutzneria albida]MBA8927986.1 Mce-associated membrane protein [Kutzneria viridogrisea]